MRVAVFDPSDRNRELWKRFFLSYSMKFNADFDVLWFSEPPAEETIRKYASHIHLAYISLDTCNGQTIGEYLYRFNPDCLICFFSSQPRDVIPLLHTRPIHFTRFPSPEDRFFALHDRLTREILLSANILTVPTRKQLYCFSGRSILYFQSDLKYVEVFTENGQSERLFCKLSELEGRLKWIFLRIHKSYIVNTAYITRVDKARHTVCLSDGTELPISTPYYKPVTDYLNALEPPLGE